MNKSENENIYEPLNSPLKIMVIKDGFTEIGEICKICSGDGWVYHSKGGQSGLTEDCPKCNGEGIIKH